MKIGKGIKDKLEMLVKKRKSFAHEQRIFFSIQIGEYVNSLFGLID